MIGDVVTFKAPRLVYVRTNGRVNAQVWRAPLLDLTNYWKDRIVAAHPLPADAADLSIKVLTQLYPPPADATEVT